MPQCQHEEHKDPSGSVRFTVDVLGEKILDVVSVEVLGDEPAAPDGCHNRIGIARQPEFERGGKAEFVPDLGCCRNPAAECTTQDPLGGAITIFQSVAQSRGDFRHLDIEIGHPQLQ